MTRMLLSLFLLWPTTSLAETPLLTATETVLPRYQSMSLDRDFPASNLLLDGSTLYVAGKRSVWRWDLNRRSLQRVTLLKDQQKSGLHDLITDGLSIMTASDHGLFRIQKEPLKVLKFTHPVTSGGKTIGLAGQNDKIFWIHSDAILHVDRYGHTLIPRYKKTGLKSDDQIVFDSHRDIIWVARGDSIFQVVLKESVEGLVKVFDTRNKILGLQLAGQQLMAYTERSVIRLDADGKHIESIPVTGSRSLATMEIRPNQHAYLFTDGLLEIFDMNKQTHRRYRLPLENAKKSILSVSASAAAIIDDGIPRVFSLSQPLK